MSQKKDENSTTLRCRAEKLLSGQYINTDLEKKEDLHQLIQELQVHQVELELQNQELREAESKLEQNRARYMKLYHNAPVGYVILNQAGIIRETNTTFANMVGAESPHIHGKPFAEFLVPVDQPIFRARLRSFFKQPIDKHIELRLKSNDKSVRYVDLAATMQNSYEVLEQTANELLVTVSDVTTRVKAEQSLQKFQDFIVAIIDSLDSNVCVLDKDGTILLVNEAWRRFAAENASSTSNLVEGANYLDVCDNAQGDETETETARLFAAEIRAILKDEKDTFTFEYPCHSPDEQRWFTGTATKLIADNGYGKIVLRHQNISARKQLEHERIKLHNQLKQIEKAESLGVMAGAIAHNFNNILAAVVGNLELAQDDAQREGETITPLVKDALSAAWRASELSSLMLTYLGQKASARQPVDFSLACNQDFHLIDLAKPRGITITTDFPAPGPCVMVDRKQVQQIVSNLVINAWESIDGKPGNIHLTIYVARSKEITDKFRYPLEWQPQKHNYACLTVQDNGSGISNEDIEKIFDPFFTSKFTGRGMGLSVILGILRSYEGGVTIKSTIDQGTVFKIYIPVFSP
ncbi:ATP-binding protein [Desulfogranum marinum]|uniref:PAS domain-containing sensor histidine kinase n=1 Tax=Desulfogranum marinum TaxID=453220 RepID=UPI0029C6E8A6|nr:ATP-binding protein [Desulfogranum marinum]